MNIFYKNLAESLMKKTDLQYKTLPGLRPAAVAPQQDMPGLPWVQKPFLSIGINGIHGPTEIHNLTPGIDTRVETFF
jgi:hypothetical protein